jgi:cytochrome c oxidase subunit 1
LKGHWAFYVGATVFVAASLVVGLLVIGMWFRFRKLHPERITPLATYMAVTFWLMWLLASLGLVVESFFLLIPWSLGLTQGVDPLLARTLFWYTGHPIVYFWLLPAYAILYLVLPRLAGGKLISDPLARVVFLLFLLFSVPVGFHHQYADPGISPTWKFIHAVLTLFVAVPSLITAFTVAASLELAGRMQGGKGLFGWIRTLPWDNPAFVAPVLGLIAFIPGGAGGIVNASYTLNYVVHNTAWVPGHFHLQVGTLVTMTMMGTVFWLVPQLTGKPLTEGIRRAGLAGVWLWFIGMMVMAVGLHWQGLLNVPRRAYISQTPEAYTHAAGPMVFNILSGIILLLAIVLFFYALFALLFKGERRAEVSAQEVPFAEVLSDGGNTPTMRLLDRIWFWFALAVLLVVLAYGPTLVQLFGNLNLVPGWRLW